MGIFKFEFEEGKKGNILVSDGGWLFAAIALPLTAITLGFSWLYTFLVARERLKAKPKAAESPRSALDIVQFVMASGGSMFSRTILSKQAELPKSTV